MSDTSPPIASHNIVLSEKMLAKATELVQPKLIIKVYLEIMRIMGYCSNN